MQQSIIGKPWNGERNVKQYNFTIVVGRAWNQTGDLKHIPYRGTVGQANEELAKVRAEYPNNPVGLKW